MVIEKRKFSLQSMKTVMTKGPIFPLKTFFQFPIFLLKTLNQTIHLWICLLMRKTEIIRLWEQFEFQRICDITNIFPPSRTNHLEAPCCILEAEHLSNPPSGQGLTYREEKG